MDEVVQSTNVWQLHHTRGELRSGSLAGDVDVTHPELGLNRLTISNHTLAGRILGVRPVDAANSSPSSGRQTPVTTEWNLADCYLRGADLVATYQPRDDWPYSTQIYWSVAEENAREQALGSLSLFVSLQTHLLDTWPALSIHSHLESEDVLIIAQESGGRAVVKSLSNGQHEFPAGGEACCVLQRLADGRVSYAEIMPASDFRKLALRHQADGACETNWQLFADFLEKGVIRRARLQARFLPRDDDIEAAMAISQAIHELPLPLTT